MTFKPRRVVVPKPVFETVSLPLTSNSPPGFTVPNPTLPLLSTINDVPVDEPMTNSGLPATDETEKMASGVLEPIESDGVPPDMEKAVDVELATLSELVPILNMPSVLVKNQFLAFVEALLSVRNIYGVFDATSSVLKLFGVFVPSPSEVMLLSQKKSLLF